MLWVFENRELMRKFGPRRDEVTGGWRKNTLRSFMGCTLRQVRGVSKSVLQWYSKC
jgi:hypothetical protein